MPPKKEEKKVEEVAGPKGDASKFAYICIASKPNIPKIRLNTNCQLDLAMNWTRQQLIVALGAATADMEEGEVKTALLDLKTVLGQLTVEGLELQEETSGAPVNAQQVRLLSNSFHVPSIDVFVFSPLPSSFYYRLHPYLYLPHLIMLLSLELEVQRVLGAEGPADLQTVLDQRRQGRRCPVIADCIRYS